MSYAFPVACLLLGALDIAAASSVASGRPVTSPFDHSQQVGRATEVREDGKLTQWQRPRQQPLRAAKPGHR